MKRTFIGALAFVLLLALASPVGAITRGGELDKGEHPYVGLMVAWVTVSDGDPETEDQLRPAWRCSGALISPTVYVTAGHCTDGAEHVAVYFDETDKAIRDAGYPFLGGVAGEAYTHPEYNDATFYLADMGVVVLDEPVELARYGELPEVGAIDKLGKGRHRAALTAVGYGLQQIYPIVEQDLNRRKATLFVVDDTGVLGIEPFIPGTNVLVSGDAKHGGTCFGDSGGPQLLGKSDTIGGVTSFGLNGACGGVGGMYRIDQVDDLDFIREFLDEVE
jgi:hypothetical protein